jgi:FeS assembly SUF system regulator
MLRISRLTDYAVVLTTELARHRGAVAVSDLSIATDIPAPTVSKVLKSLAKYGVVVSSRGTNGGYRLSDEPDRIGIVRVIEAIEGPIAVTECAEEHTSCEHETSCGVRANWQRINRAVHDALAQITIADMTSPSIGGARLVPLLRSVAEADDRRSQPAADGAAVALSSTANGRQR